MKPFLSEDFLLETETARILYHTYAKEMPIFDFHCHLPVRQIADNVSFANLTRIWLEGDHYKWRAIRTNGIAERFISGDATDYEKFEAWAGTVPKTIGNPLYHWTHMELKRPFGISGKLLGPETSREIYDACKERLETEDFKAQGLLRQMNVKALCTTDDPVDTLEHHRRIQEDPAFSIQVLPGFRSDRALAAECPREFNLWTDRLEGATEMSITGYSSFLEALRKRREHFHKAGCRVSDHALEQPYATDYTRQEIQKIFQRLRQGIALETREIVQFKSATLIELAVMDREMGWVQQFHVGALRNTNTRAMQTLGPDSGYDCMGDLAIARPLADFLDTLDRDDRLAKTILYVLNPRDNEMIASMIGCFQDGSFPGKIQFGPAWWFNDQKSGIQRHLDALSNMGLLSRFVGMVSDSRSFLSYSRHEYFRRVLCNLFGSQVETGDLPKELEMLGSMVQDISYRNAAAYFGLSPDEDV